MKKITEIIFEAKSTFNHGDIVFYNGDAKVFVAGSGVDFLTDVKTFIDEFVGMKNVSEKLSDKFKKQLLLVDSDKVDDDMINKFGNVVNKFNTTGKKII